MQCCGDRALALLDDGALQGPEGGGLEQLQCAERPACLPHDDVDRDCADIFHL